MEYKHDRKFQLTLKETYMYLDVEYMFQVLFVRHLNSFFKINSTLWRVLANQMNTTAHAPKPVHYQQKTGCLKLLTYLFLQTRSYA